MCLGEEGEVRYEEAEVVYEEGGDGCCDVQERNLG